MSWGRRRGGPLRVRPFFCLAPKKLMNTLLLAHGLTKIGLHTNRQMVALTLTYNV